MFPLLEGNDIKLITTVFPVIEGIDIHFKTYVFRKTDHEYPVFAHPALVLKRDFERNKKLQDDRICELTNREVVKFSILDFVERTCVGWCQFFSWIEPLFCEHTGGNFSACDSSRNLLHVSSFVVCGSSGDKFHTPGISCWTLAHCARFSSSSICLSHS